jgi:hypothetical protein
VSAAIIVVLAVALSPYILIGLVALLLVVGVPNLPPFLQPLVPAPIVQVNIPSPFTGQLLVWLELLFGTL